MNTPKPTASIREAIYSKAELPINSYTGFIWEVHTRDYPEDYIEYMEQLGDTYPKKTRKEAQDWHNASPKVVMQALCGQLNFVVRQTLTAIELPTN